MRHHGSGTESPAPQRGAIGRLLPAALVAVALALTGCANGAPAPQRTTPAPAAAAAQPAETPVPAAPSAPTAPEPDGLPAVPVVDTTPRPPRKVVAPVRVTIPGHPVDMRIVPVGVASGGGMSLPANPAIAGWYRFGPDARAPHGSIVVAAHVDSIRYGLGPFVHIRDLPKDTRIRIQDGGGRTTVYRVQEVRHVKKADLTKEGVFSRGGDRRLTLITCGGSFDTRTRTYSDNVIVTARPIGR